MIKFKKDFLCNYLKEAPIPLAVERSLECEIMSKQQFFPPVLDLGCGEGLFTYVLFAEKIDVGIDPNKKELKRAKEYRAYKELIKCFGHDILKESCSYNTIFSNSVLEHIQDIGSVLKEVHRLLTPTGRFYVTVPTEFFDHYTVLYQLFSLLGLNRLRERYRLWYNRFWKHYHYHSPEKWKTLFQEYDFEVINVQGYCPKRVCFFNDLLIPFCIPNFFTKKVLNRWILFPRIRKIYAPFLCRTLKFILRTTSLDVKKSGIVFFALKKSNGV